MSTDADMRRVKECVAQSHTLNEGGGQGMFSGIMTH